VGVDRETKNEIAKIKLKKGASDQERKKTKSSEKPPLSQTDIRSRGRMGKNGGPAILSQKPNVLY